METKGWRTVEGKAMQRKRKTETTDKPHAMETNGKSLTIQNGGRGKKSHQLMKTNTSPKITWVDVVKARGINIQIVLGNGNLGLTTLIQKWGERHGRVAWRLAKRGEDLI
jgi:hypothetical protein